MTAQEGAHFSVPRRPKKANSSSTKTTTTTTETDKATNQTEPKEEIVTTTAATTTTTSSSSATVTALRKLSQALLQQDQYTTSTGTISQSSSSSSNYISNLVNKSGVFLGALKDQYASYLTAGGGAGCGERAGEPAPGGCQQDGGGAVSAGRKRSPGCVEEGSSDPARTTMTTGNNMQSSLSTEETRGASSDGSNGGGAGYPAGPASSFSLPSLSPRSGPMVTSRQPLAELTSTSENASRTTIDGGKDEEDQHRASATATSANQQAAPSKARAGELIGGGGTLVRSTTDDGSPWVEQAQRSISGQARPQVLSNYCSNHSQEQNTTTTARTNNNNEKQQWRQEGSSRREEDEERGEGGEEVAGRRGSRRNMTNPYGDLTAISDNANKQQQQLQLQLRQQLPQSTTDDVRNRDNQFGSMGDGGQSAALPSPPPPMPQSPMTARPSEPSQSSGDSTMAPAEQGDPNGCGDSNCSTPRRPPLPPPPPREILQAVAARSAPTLGPNGGATTSTTNTNTGQISAHKDDSYGGGGSKTAGTTSGGGSSSTTTSGHQQPRRYALQEHSLERDAALSFKVVHAKELKHKRTSSIKSVLRHAHLGPLRPSTSKRAAGKAAREAAGALAALASHPGELGCKKSTSGGSGANKAPKSMPYELFEPPVTQRTVERSKRRGAMASQLSATTPGDSSTTGGGGGSISGTSAEAARRQLSFDTIGLRQLTDEYLQNAGLKQPAGASMVALSEPTNTRQPSAKPGTIAVPGGSSTVAAVVAATVGNSADPSAAAASQAHCALEAQLYQATREAAAKLESDYYQDQYGNYLCCSSSLGTTSSSQPGSAGGGGGGLRNHPQHSHQNQKLTNSAGSLERHDRPGPRSNLYYQDNPITSSSSANTSEVTVLPGQLPWQSDVSIQCELLQAPTTLEPYETTGDILNTITRPFRGPPLNNYSHTISFESSSSHHHHHHHHAHGQHHHHHHLSATLKRGLSAISQHHLSPGGSLAGSMALNVVGSLKKSISNTFDVGPKAPISSQQQQQQQQSGQHTHTHHHHHHQLASLGQTLNLRSDDSLPAYASLNNEPDDESAGSSNSDQHHHHHYPQQQQLQSPASHHQAQAASGGGGGASEQQQQLQQSGLIGQLASKLSRQSSKKFTEGKRGLQRALSFDCRGYKRLDAAGCGQSTITGAGSGVRQQTSVTQTSADSTCSSLGSNGGPSSAMGAAKSLAAGTSSSSNGQQLLAARQRVHNKSTLALQSPRPYLPQSASQVDFQVPLLPYERMQEAIVSQRLLEPPQVSSPSSVGGGGGLGSGNDHQDQQQQQQRIQSTGKQPDADELICGGGGHSVTGFGDNQRAGARSNFMERNPAWNLDDNMARNDDDQKEEDREEAPGPAAPPSTPQLKARSSQQRETTTRLASGESLVTNEAALMGAPTGSELALAYQRQDTMTRSERGTPPRLVLNIPTISTAHGSSTSETNEFELELGPNDAIEMAAMGGGGGSSGGGPEENTAASAVGAGANQAASGGGQATTVITCLPSPSAQLEPSGSFELGLPSSGQLSQSPSFCLDAAGASSGGQRGTESNLLTASDVFRRSKNFIKRPSTMMASDEAEDAMNQVAAALGQATSMKQQADLSTNGSIRRNRRQAIVPPKLATDACCTSSESESCQPQVGRLVDLDDDREPNSVGRLRQPASRGERRQRYYRESSSMDEFCAEEEAQLSTIRRKRSGGGIEKLPSNATGAQPAANSSQAQQQQQRAPSAAVVTSQSNTNAEESRGPLNLPTFQIEDPQSTTMSPATGIGLAAAMGLNHHHQQPSERPDSQATNADSIVSSESTVSVCMGPGRGPSPFGGVGSSGAPSPNGTCGASSYGSAAGSLAVPFTSGSSSRRRSSIAVIPQMQICPGDLLVYSKQLIDRMNQTDENEPPQFLTIDEKKGKNIWSSFKLCAQFDNRTMRARNELLCSLEDVLVSLQPSTFVDEQLSHYKGMLWNEFLCETESRRSASSEAMSGNEDSAAATNENENDTSGGNRKKKSYKDELIDSIEVRVEGPSPVNGTLPDGQEVMVPQTSSTGTSNSAKPPLPHEGHRRAGSMRGDELSSSATKSIMAHEGVKTTMSTGGSGASAGQTTSPQRTSGDKQQQGLTNGQPQQRTISSRFREKPKLKRGQTVDSVFRIPLIPSSPLKHAQQHQQTPTAHLEDHDLNTIEDDERSSMGSANSGGGGSGAMNDDQHRSMFGRRKRSSSTRSRSSGRPDERVGCEPTAPAVSSTTIGARSGTSQGEGANSSNKSLGNCGPQQSPSQDSSFDTEDARDLMEGPNAGGARSSRRSPTTPNQLVRQTSLSTLSSTITRTEQKRQRALWDLFQSECTFFFDHLLTLKNVYMEPLKKIQVEGFAMFADPDVLFGNLDELCCGVYDFCKEFLYIIMRTLKTRPEELNATDVLIKLYKKNPKIDHLRAVYHRYTLNYINALTYLDSLRRQVEFVEFEKWSSRDVRCKKLQLTDLLVAPVQHIMRVPIILKDIEAHTENVKDREEIRAILAVEEASLRELDDKMRWLKNFERLLEIQKNIQWPSVFDMEPKLYVPEFLKEVLSKQPCEKLIVSPKRQIVHEGTLSNLDLNGKASDMHVILFDDMLLMTRRKKQLTKKSSTVCKTNSSGGQHSSGSHSASSMLTDDGTFKYVVYKQPLSLDRFYVHDVQQVDSQSIGIKHLFLLIVMNRFQQIINIHSFAAPNDDMKQTWLFKIKKTAERWKRINSSSSSSSQHQQQQQQQQKQQQQQQHHHHNHHQQSRNLHQEPPVAQQPGISTSKSMPMTQSTQPQATAQAGSSMVSRSPAAQAQQSTSHHTANVQQGAPPMASQGRHNDSKSTSHHQRQGGGSGGVWVHGTGLGVQQPQAPIEFVITSASESPASEQQKCR